MGDNHSPFDMFIFHYLKAKELCVSQPTYYQVLQLHIHAETVFKSFKLCFINTLSSVQIESTVSILLHSTFRILTAIITNHNCQSTNL